MGSASHALQQIDKLKKDQLVEFGGKESNKFVDNVKSSFIFQQDWSELLSAAPLALATLGSCWIAAADPMAYEVSMKDSQPTGGFKHLTKRPNPSLRSCLVDVGQIGGISAFTVAGANMSSLQVISRRIQNERIPMVFKRLPSVTQGADQLEDFQDALADLRKDSKLCSELAEEVRVAFTRWGMMCTELQGCCESQITTTAIKRKAAQIDEDVTKIQERFAIDTKSNAEANVKTTKDQMIKAEKRLDEALKKIPSSWDTMLQGILSSFANATIGLIGGSMRDKDSNNNNNSNQSGAGGKAPQQGSNLSDPAYASAVALRPIVNSFYEFLGGDAGKPSWDKFTGAGPDAQDTTGIAWLLGNFTAQKTKTDVTNTDPNRKFIAALDQLIKVSTDIKTQLGKQSEMSAPAITDDQLAPWKKEVKQAKDEVISLATVSVSNGTNGAPTPFANSTNAPKTDNSAQVAQTNAAAEAARMAQVSADNAAASYEKATEKQSQAAAKLADVQAKLKDLQETGKTLEKIKDILRAAVDVLADLVVQVLKIERFFKMLEQIVNVILLPKVEEFNRDMDKVGTRALRDNGIAIDFILKQSIYGTTLQMKAYFSLLEDISMMYTEVHNRYITDGLAMCSRLSKGAAVGQVSSDESDALQRYTVQSSAAVAKLVKDKQDEILAKLKDRARKAADETNAITKVIMDAGLPVIGQGTVKAIEAGSAQTQAEAQKMIEADAATHFKGTDLNDI